MIDTIFSPANEEILREGFGKKFLLEIADELGCSDVELMYRARQMDLRKYCEYLPMERVVAWLGVSESKLKAAGVPIMVCKDDFDIPLVRLVSFAGLTDLWKEESVRAEFFAKADPFLCMELADLINDIDTFSARWEDSFWTSHEHTHFNPRSEKFGDFYIESDDIESDLLVAETNEIFQDKKVTEHKDVSPIKDFSPMEHHPILR